MPSVADLAVSGLAALTVVALGFVFYGLTCAAFWLGMAAYRASRCLRRERQHLPERGGEPLAGRRERGRFNRPPL